MDPIQRSGFPIKYANYGIYGASIQANKGPILRNQIRRLRFDHGEMIQQDLAERVQVTRQTIIAPEANQYAPSLVLAFRIARVFGVPVEQVFQYEFDS